VEQLLSSPLKKIEVEAPQAERSLDVGTFAGNVVSSFLSLHLLNFLSLTTRSPKDAGSHASHPDPLTGLPTFNIQPILTRLIIKRSSQPLQGILHSPRTTSSTLFRPNDTTIKALCFENKVRGNTAHSEPEESRNRTHLTSSDLVGHQFSLPL
jgi:hypothetical protein